jgi:RNA polymerase sigma-19 factor, ECF subfamily
MSTVVKVDVLARDDARPDDSPEFDRLFRRYFDQLTRQVARMVDCEHIAEELVQDVFLRVWSGREGLAVRGDVGHYLRRAARNRALDWLRREDLRHEWAQSARLEVAQLVAEMQASEWDDLAHLSTTMAECLAEMPVRRRLVCELRWRHDLGPSLIAERLGLSVKTVEAHLTCGNKDLRARIQ